MTFQDGFAGSETVAVAELLPLPKPPVTLKVAPKLTLLADVSRPYQVSHW